MTKTNTVQENSAKPYDLIVIGAGPAGYTAALEAAGKGMRTAIVERRELGGTCLNRGCIPTKTILHSAELFAHMRSCASLGISAENVTCDMAAVQRRKEEVVAQLRSGIASLMKKNKVDVYEGQAVLSDPHTVKVYVMEQQAEQTLHAEYILLATGSEPALPPIPGIRLENVVTSDELLARESLYPRLTIIGGGVIGMEFASIYCALGCEVTVIEFLDRILANMEKEISQNLKMILKKRGVEIHTGAQVQEIVKNEDGSLTCRYMEKGELREVVSDGVLAAVGRRAVTDGLPVYDIEQKTVPEQAHDAEQGTVPEQAHDAEQGTASEQANDTEQETAPEQAQKLAVKRGRIVVNDCGQTSIPNIYAAGDVTPGIQLAHAASAQAINAVAHMLALREGGEFCPSLHTDLIPGCVYTDPEIGCVGITQEEAKAEGRPVVVKKYPMSANGKTVLSGQERGFIKVVADADDHRILGAQMMCARATDMIGEFGTAIVNGLTLEQMAAVVRPHPTFSEGISEVTRG